MNLTLDAVRYHAERDMAELKLGVTKMDIEGRGKRRCFSCTCAVVELRLICPACAIKNQIDFRISEGACGSDPLFASPGGYKVQAAGLLKVWAEMCHNTDKLDDHGEPIVKEVTEHTPRRTGAQFHAKRGLMLWQIQYLGRWGGSSVELYVAEAMADLRATWSKGTSSDSRNLDAKELDGRHLWELEHAVEEAKKNTKDVKELMSKLLSEGVASNVYSDKDALMMEELVAEVVEKEADVELLSFTAANIVKLSTLGLHAVVVNKENGTVHGASIEALGCEYPASWISACGWHFAPDGMFLSTSRTPGVRCGRKGCKAYFNKIGEGADEEKQRYLMMGDVSDEEEEGAGQVGNA